MRRKNVLCVCSKGRNRSKYLADYLRRKGYSTKYGGIEKDAEAPAGQKMLTQNEANWADIVIVVRKRLAPKLKRLFKFKGKMIVLDVTDSRRLIPDAYAHLRVLPHAEFQRKWTRPQLRKEINRFMPL